MYKIGDKVIFTGHGYRRAMTYKYAGLFGQEEWEIEDIRTSCCNTFLILKNVPGMYCDVFFSPVDTPGTPIP